MGPQPECWTPTRCEDEHVKGCLGFPRLGFPPCNFSPEHPHWQKNRHVEQLRGFRPPNHLKSRGRTIPECPRPAYSRTHRAQGPGCTRVRLHLGLGCGRDLHKPGHTARVTRIRGVPNRAPTQIHPVTDKEWSRHKRKKFVHGAENW